MNLITLSRISLPFILLPFYIIRLDLVPIPIIAIIAFIQVSFFGLDLYASKRITLVWKPSLYFVVAAILMASSILLYSIQETNIFRETYLGLTIFVWILLLSFVDFCLRYKPKIDSRISFLVLILPSLVIFFGILVSGGFALGLTDDQLLDQVSQKSLGVRLLITKVFNFNTSLTDPNHIAYWSGLVILTAFLFINKFKLPKLYQWTCYFTLSVFTIISFLTQSRSALFAVIFAISLQPILKMSDYFIRKSKIIISTRHLLYIALMIIVALLIKILLADFIDFSVFNSVLNRLWDYTIYQATSLFDGTGADHSSGRLRLATLQYAALFDFDCFPLACPTSNDNLHNEALTIIAFYGYLPFLFLLLSFISIIKIIDAYRLMFEPIAYALFYSMFYPLVYSIPIALMFVCLLIFTDDCKRRIRF